MMNGQMTSALNVHVAGKCSKGTSWLWIGLSAVIWGGSTGSANAEQSPPPNPIVIERQGAFEAGGRTIGGNGQSLSCDHGYVEYQIPENARDTALFMWHSSSAAVWQNSWDGGEGYQSIFLRQGYPVYLWDGPRVGRGNWGCEGYEYTPQTANNEQSFVSWRFGPQFGEFFDGVQFPIHDQEAWNQAVRARYAEFDTIPNAKIEAKAAVAALDRIGPSVLVTNSAGGFRALLSALESENVKAIVAYENPGFILPEGTEQRGGPGRFPPVYVSEEEFRKLTRLPIQMVFGDFVNESAGWSKVRGHAEQFVELVNERGGQAELLDLPEAGLKGNTHMPFADLNNADVAKLLSEFIERHGLSAGAVRIEAPE